MEKMKQRNIKNYIIPIVLSILILGVISVFAVNTYISDLPNRYFNAENVTINNSGVYYKTSADIQKLTKTADVVVCRGTSALDDLIKSFYCDVVCNSTDNDCGNEFNDTLIQAKSNNGLSILIKGGTYPCITNISLDNLNNTEIYGEGIGYTILNGCQFKKYISSNTYNLKFHDFTDNLLSQYKSAIEINSYTYNAEIYNVYFLNTSGNPLIDWGGSDNFYLHNSIFEDSGMITDSDEVMGSQLTTENGTSRIEGNTFIRKLSTANEILTTPSTGNLIIDKNTFIDYVGVYNAISIETAFTPSQINGNIVISNNIINTNKSVLKANIHVGNAGGGVVKSAHIYGNILEGEIRVMNVTNVNIHDNMINNSYFSGITSYYTQTLKIHDNIIFDTDFFNTQGLDYGAQIFVLGLGDSASEIYRNTLKDYDGNTSIYYYSTAREQKKVFIEDNIIEGIYNNYVFKVQTVDTLKYKNNFVNVTNPIISWIALNFISNQLNVTNPQSYDCSNYIYQGEELFNDTTVCKCNLGTWKCRSLEDSFIDTTNLTNVCWLNSTIQNITFNNLNTTFGFFTDLTRFYASNPTISLIANIPTVEFKIGTGSKTEWKWAAGYQNSNSISLVSVNSSNNQVIYANINGSVGINTTNVNPINALTIKGNMYVSGTANFTNVTIFSGNTLCLDGESCLHYIKYNGTCITNGTACIG